MGVNRYDSARGTDRRSVGGPARWVTVTISITATISIAVAIATAFTMASAALDVAADVLAAGVGVLSAISLGVEGLASGGGPGEPTVGRGCHRPTFAVRDTVVVSTQRRKIRQVGSSTPAPRVYVVGVGPFRWGVTSREDASSVAVRHRPALSSGREASCPPEVGDDPFGVHHDGVEHRITQAGELAGVTDDDSVTARDRSGVRSIDDQRQIRSWSPTCTVGAVRLDDEFIEGEGS